jgi:hypothetical protein
LAAQQARILRPPQRGAYKRHVIHECTVGGMRLPLPLGEGGGEG